MDHFDEELELYALGMLEPGERDRVDVHVRTCDACAERLGRAEGAVACTRRRIAATADAPAPGVADGGRRGLRSGRAACCSDKTSRCAAR